MAQDSVQDSTASGGVAFGQRCELFPQMPLPELNGAGGPAYAARLRDGGGGADLAGILCTSHLPPRLDHLSAMRSVGNPGLLRLIDSGVVAWPGNGQRHYTLAYQRPLAPKLKHSLDESHAPLNDDLLITSFVAPLVGALLELARVGVMHGGIRTTNIFWRAGGVSPPQLGECLSAPAGLDQPVLFETVERALCPPAHRGAGAYSDDAYAFGVTLALMLQGRNPLAGLDDQAIIKAKIERGSFAILLGNRRLSANFTELLRGLLADEPKLRWGPNDLEQWQQGRRLTPKSADTGRRAARAFDFNGAEYWQLRPLAMALAAAPSQALQTIEGGLLDKWLRRSLGNEDQAERLEQAQQSLKRSGKTGSYEDQLVARACIALDPAAPVRYRGVTVLPGGMAGALTEAVVKGNGTQPLSEMIASQLLTFWIEMQKDVKTDLVPLGQQFERLKGLIDKQGYGNGVERVLYELNTGLPCLSPMLRAAYVTSPKQLVAGLEQVAASGNRGREPMDRHIAAYLIVHDRRSELLFEAMTAPDSSPRRGLALLTLYGELQYRHGPNAAPQLAQWLLALLEPAMQRFLGKGLREKLRGQVKELAAKGDIGGLLRLLDDPRRIEGDQQEFMAARLLYLNTLKEINTLEARLANREQVINDTGKPMAATIASFLAILLVIAAIARAVLQAFG